jgi:hypothetical protein
MDLMFTQIESDDGELWYSMKCQGSLANTNTYLHISSQNFIYATDSEEQISGAYVYGDSDMSLDSILLSFLPILIPIFYLLIMILSFVKKNNSLGFGLLGGIIVAPVSFCFSIILLAFLFFDSW